MRRWKILADGKVTIDVILNDGSLAKGVADIKDLGDSGKKAGAGIKEIATSMGLVKLASGAINLVKSSMDSAISRFDTMQKFPKVMEALGFSAEDSTKSINKLSDGIDGLPTKLDDVVAQTQQLASTTGDLDRSTDTVIALNNAFLASGASTDQASRGMDQFNKMLASGKVDAMSWDTLMQTMPLSLTKVAEAMGYTGKTAKQDLYNALKDGTKTFDEFQDKLIELGTGTGMLADLAKKNSLGISTSFTNLKNSIAKNMAKVIEKVDEMAQKLTGKNIAQNIDSLKVMINNTFDFIIQNMDKVIPVIENVISTFKKVSEFIEPLIPVIAGVAGAFLTYQAVMGTAQKAVELFNGAQKIFNALLSANPIGIIATAIIGLIALMVYLYNTNEDFRNAVINTWNAITEFLQPIIQAIVDFVKDIWGSLVEWWKQNGEYVKETISIVWESIKTTITQVMEFLAPYIQTTWENIKTVVEFVWNTIKNVIETAMGVIQGIISVVMGLIRGDWGQVWDGIKQIVSSIMNGIKTHIDNVLNATKNIVSNILNGIKDIFSRILNSAKQVVSDKINAIKNLFTSLGNIDLFSAGKAIIDGFLRGLKSAYEGVKNFVGGIAGWIKDHKGPISYDKRLLIPAGNAIMDGLDEGLQSQFKRVQSTIQSMADKLQTNFEVGFNANYPQVALPKVSSAESLLWADLKPTIAVNNVYNNNSNTVAKSSNNTPEKISIELYPVIELDKRVVSRELAEPIKAEIDLKESLYRRTRGLRN